MYKHDICSGSVHMYIYIIYIYIYHFILHSEFLATTKNMFFLFGGNCFEKNVSAVYVKCQNHDMWFVDPQNH